MQNKVPKNETFFCFCKVEVAKWGYCRVFFCMNR